MELVLCNYKVVCFVLIFNILLLFQIFKQHNNRATTKPTVVAAAATATVATKTKKKKIVQFIFSLTIFFYF